MNHESLAKLRELQVGRAYTLFPQLARTTPGTDVLGTAQANVGAHRRWQFLLNLSAAATDAGDTLDVYVDFSLEGTIWIPVVHFNQCLGTGGAKKYWATLEAVSPGTSVLDVAATLTAGSVRPTVIGPQVRGRYTLVDADADASFNFGLFAFGL